jgi:probable HAF family extracellular repeat protein
VGQIVGYAGTSSPGYHAFLWQDGMMNDLDPLAGGASKADAINDAGQVVGYSTVGNVQHAVLWQDGGIIDLGTLPGDDNSEATAINNLGHIVGWSADFDLTQFRAVFPDGGVGPPDSIATGINDSDQVVGYTHFLAGGTEQRAFIYADGVLTDLNTLIPPGPGLILTTAQAINNNGQIVGIGLNTVENHWRGYLLTPDARSAPHGPAAASALVSAALAPRALFPAPDAGVPWKSPPVAPGGPAFRGPSGTGPELAVGQVSPPATETLAVSAASHLGADRLFALAAAGEFDTDLGFFLSSAGAGG